RRKAHGHLRVRVLRSTAVLLGHEIRVGHRLAELLCRRGQGRGERTCGQFLVHAADRGALRRVRRAPRSCLPGRTKTNRVALLHEWMRIEIRAEKPVKMLDEPRAEQRPHARTYHGITLEDEFAWLKAANWQEVMRDPQRLDPAIRAYLEAENAYCDRALADTT